MPSTTLRHRGGRHGIGHGPLCKRRVLGTMTISELLNHSNNSRINNRIQRPRNCEIYRRECIRSYSDDETECLELNNDKDTDYVCAGTPSQVKVVGVLVRECTYSDEDKPPCPYARAACDPSPCAPLSPLQTSLPCSSQPTLCRTLPPCKALPPSCHTPPLCERPLTCQTGLPSAKPPPSETSTVISPTCSNTIIQCDDCYVGIPSPNTDPICDRPSYKKPLSCQKPVSLSQVLSLCNKPPPCNKLQRPCQIPLPSKTLLYGESRSVIICDPEEDKICRRVSFGSVSELKIPPFHKEVPCAFEGVRVEEIPLCAVASTKASESCAAQMDAPYTCSIEAQNNLGVYKKESVPIEVCTQTCSESPATVYTCGARNCPKSITAKSKHGKDFSKAKQQKGKKEAKKCDRKNCPKSSSAIYNSPPCLSPTTSKKNLKVSNGKKKQIKCKCPLSPSKSPPSALTPSTSKEIVSEIIYSDKYDEKEQESKPNLHKNSSNTSKKSWFRKSKVKAPLQDQQNTTDSDFKKNSQEKEMMKKTTTVSIMQDHGGQFASGGQYIQQAGFAMSAQALLPSGFAPNRQSIHSVFNQSTGCCSSCSSKFLSEQYTLGELLVPREQNMYSQLPHTDKISQPYKTTLASQKLPRNHGSCSGPLCDKCSTKTRTMYCHRRPPVQRNQEENALNQFFNNGQSLPEQLIMADRMSPNQFSTNEQMPQGQFTLAMHTSPEVTSQGVQTSPSQFTPRAQMPQRQFASGIQTQRLSQSIQPPSRKFLASREQFPVGQCAPESQMLQQQFLSEMQTPPGLFSQSAHTNQSKFYLQKQFSQDQFISGGQILQGKFISKGQFAPVGLISQGQFSPEETFPQGLFPSSEYFIQSQLASGGQFPLGQFAPEKRIPQDQNISRSQISQDQFGQEGQVTQSQYAPGLIPQGQFASRRGLLKSQFEPGQIAQGQFTLRGQFLKNQLAPNGQNPQGERVPGQILQSQLATDRLKSQGEHFPGQILKTYFAPGPIPQRLFAPGGQFPTTQIAQIPQAQVSRSELVPDQTLQTQLAPDGQNSQGELVPEQILQTQLAPDGQNLQGELVPGEITRTHFASGPIPLRQFGGITRRGQFTPDTYDSDRDNSASGQFLGKMSLLQEQAPFSPGEVGLLYSGGPNSPEQYIPLLSGQFVTEGQIPPKQSISGGRSPSRQSILQQIQARSRPVSEGPIPLRAPLSGGNFPFNQYISTELPKDPFGPEDLNRKKQGYQLVKPLSLDKADHCATIEQNWNKIILTPCGSEGNDITINISPCGSESSLCNCADVTCTCEILEGRSKCRNKEKSPKYCQDAGVQCTQTRCCKSLIVNTSFGLHHPNTLPAKEIPKVSDNLRDILKSNEGCECHYPPKFQQFQCSGNVCGTCQCREKQHK